MKFNLRDLFWLTAVIALSLGWWTALRVGEGCRDKHRKLVDALLELETSGLDGKDGLYVANGLIWIETPGGPGAHEIPRHAREWVVGAKKLP